jgi:hypothetical protein
LITTHSDDDKAYACLFLTVQAKSCHYGGFSQFQKSASCGQEGCCHPGAKNLPAQKLRDNKAIHIAKNVTLH